MMEQTPFDRELTIADNRLTVVTELMEYIKVLTFRKNYAEAEREAVLLAEAAEKLALQSRALPVYLGNPQMASLIEKQLEELWDIDMEFTKQGWFSLRIPALLPKKASGSAEFIRSMLYPGMKRFFHSRQPTRYLDSVIVFRHVYNRQRPERQYRDHDNIETNMVVDIIALYLLPDDAPLRCAHFYCTTAGDSDCTEVFVVPKSEFVLWLDIFYSEDNSDDQQSGVPP